MNISESITKRPLISLTPLIDVVFILLIFFMLASSFIKWNFIELGIGEAESLSLNTDTQSIIKIGFEQQYQLNEKPMPLDDIISAIKEQVRKQVDHSILIQPTSDLPLQQLVLVLDALKDVGGANISLVKDDKQ